MFWGDRITTEIQDQYADAVTRGDALIIRDEKTASGRVHVGSLRGVAVHGIVNEILSESGVANTFLYEINDFDPMDGLPVYLDADTYTQHMGKPLCNVPAPDKTAENFAEYYGNEFLTVMEETGFYPEVYRASELYKSGRMDDVIRTALEHADAIREIYKKRSGSEKPDGWLPLSVLCEKCGKIGTTHASDFDGETVAYTCKPDLVEWATGCGNSGRVSPFGGNAKLPWKVEWAAKFKVLGVSIEGGGKDHSTKGGSRDVANHIARDVFSVEPPFDIPYEFFLVGGKKMSSSKGGASSAREIANLIPPEILRLALIGKDPMRAFDFEPNGDTVPNLFDLHDKLAEKYFAGTEDDDTRLFKLLYPPDDRATLSNHFRPRFSQIAFLVQMPHMDMEEEVARIKGEVLTKVEKQEVSYRAEYAKYWLDTYADEAYIYELQEELPDAASALTEEQKQGLGAIYEAIMEMETLDGQELHTKLHDIRKSLDIDAKAFFSALYIVLLDKESGPKAGWFLSVLNRDFLLTRLQEIAGAE